MKKLEKINQSYILFTLILLGIFILMTALNFLTPYLADDFDYMYSYATGERISSIADIFPSMVEHRNILGGRVVAHFFVQLFLWLPKPVFNVVNGGMFTLLIYLIYLFSNNGRKRNNLLFFALFGAVWYFELSFGSVNLWLDGSVNYLWASVLCLAYLFPIFKKYFYRSSLKNPFLIALYLLGCLLTGAYSENGSIAVMAVIFILCLLILFYRKEKLEWYYIAGFGLSCLGYLFLITAPAVGTRYSSAVDIASIGNQFSDVMIQYRKAFPLLALFIVLFIFSMKMKCEKQIIQKAGLFLAASLVSNFIMMAASYYADRSMAFPMIFLIIADGILITELFGSRLKECAVSIMAVMALLIVFEVPIGAKDIYTTYRKVNLNKEYVQDMKNSGYSDVLVPIPVAESKYSALYSLMYLNCEDTDAFPNDAIKRYYGLDSIVGFYPESETIWRSGPLINILN